MNGRDISSKDTYRRKADLLWLSLLNVTVYGKYLYVYMCHQTPNRVILMKRDTHSQVKVGAQGLGDKRISLSIVVVDDHSVICKCKSGNAFTGG